MNGAACVCWLVQGNRRQVDRAKLEQAVEEVEYDGKFTGMFKINYDKLADPKKCERMAKELFEAGTVSRDVKFRSIWLDDCRSTSSFVATHIAVLFYLCMITLGFLWWCEDCVYLMVRELAKLTLGFVRIVRGQWSCWMCWCSLGEDKWGTDEATFNRIFSTQDFYTLRSVYDKYVKVGDNRHRYVLLMAYSDSAVLPVFYHVFWKSPSIVCVCITLYHLWNTSQITQRDILNSVDRETSGDFRRGLCAVAQSVKCRPKFFAEALHRSMKGLGTDDSTLIRICVSRSEVRH